MQELKSADGLQVANERSRTEKPEPIHRQRSTLTGQFFCPKNGEYLMGRNLKSKTDARSSSGECWRNKFGMFATSRFTYTRKMTGAVAARTASVGTIIGFRPHLQVVVLLNHRDFDGLWSMALTGHVRYAHLMFTKPHYNRAGSRTCRSQPSLKSSSSRQV
jgi:hypothetical protein